MNAELSLMELLSQNARLTALVADKIGPWTTGQAASPPSVTYHRTSTTRHPHFRGSTPLAWAMMQVDSRGRTQMEAKQVAEQVRLSLDMFRGRLGPKQVAGIFNDTEFDFQEHLPGSEVPIYGVQQEYKIVCNERVAALIH